MSIALTEHQLMVVKQMVEYGEAFSKQILHIMQNHGLDKINGFEFAVRVDPKWHFMRETIHVGGFYTDDSGAISLSRGENEIDFTPYGKNSPEYELLFANEAVRGRMEKIVRGEKPLPPDGLWIGNHPDADPLDSGEWDINDSLS